ncbi:MAG TPA: SGNH/GDSL hydrolase family protein [Thermoanaerobaculia bacterium]|nr:SGNH/GDSL hydrolase family protein [Thermoanaerobaculia bacterium]
MTASFLLFALALRTFGTHEPAITYVVLGDSTAAGVGADYESGIAVGTAQHLAIRRKVLMTNFAVSGARIRDVVEDQLAGAETLKPDVVLLAVGANDVIHLTCVSSMRRDLLEIVRRLRVANEHVKIVITGSPDMGSPPRVPRLLRPVASWRTHSVNRMFRAIAKSQHLTFAPIAEETGPLFRRDPSLFEADRFHPNERGYATWIVVLNRAFDSIEP